MTKIRTYIAIDLKSFYASVECVERGLDPLKTNLVVADESRTEKTICLAVSPSLKSYGIPGRPRLFEVAEKIRTVNEERRAGLQISGFEDVSVDADEIKERPGTAVGFITAVPRMSLYIKYSVDIYNIYLKYVSAEDIHVYSIDEVFMDATDYLDIYKMTAEEFAAKLVYEVYDSTGITATAGIGTNLYLCKVAMDIVAKHMAPRENGVRIASLDEMSYRKLLWSHKPLTDFWRVGRGYQKRLHEAGIYTMGDIARCSVGGPEDYYNEELLYKLFGVNAELLIDHAWGYEPCTIADVKSYKPESSSISSGQVLTKPYDWEKGRLIVWEMTDLLALDLVEKKLVADQVVLTIGYDIENLSDPKISELYKGPVTVDYYGRKVPKHAHGTAGIGRFTSSSRLILDAVMKLYDEITDKNLLIRRVNVCANHVVSEDDIKEQESYKQLNLFEDFDVLERERKKEEEELAREKKMQEAVISIKKKYGRNAILKGANLQDGAMTVERNRQIGGHKA